MSDTTQRRVSPRRRFSCRARFRDPRAFHSGTERVCVTRDFSRDGVYFIADGNGLRENMQLVLRFPESLPATQDREYLVKIMRVTPLAEDRCGVAARLILRTAAGQMEKLVAPKVDLSPYGCLDGPAAVVDLYA